MDGHDGSSRRRTGGWTPGQYALLRVLLALVVGADALARSPVPLAAALSLPLALGWRDRLAAALLCAWLAARPLVLDLPFPDPSQLALVPLLLHLLLPATPRRPPAPDEAWRIPPVQERLALVLGGLAVAGAVAGPLVLDLLSPGGRGIVDPRAAPWAAGALFALALLYVPLSLLPRTRPVVWCAVTGLVLALLVEGALAAPAHAVLAAHLLVVQLRLADPAWVPPRAPAEEPTVFYDGSCGLCHRTVLFVLSEDRRAAPFRYATLDGETLRERLPAEQRAALPDAVVLLADGRVDVRSDAVAGILARLGGAWRILGGVLRAVPRPLRDGAYDLVARLRRRIFPRPEGSCPVVPGGLRERFLP